VTEKDTLLKRLAVEGVDFLGADTAQHKEEIEATLRWD